jgi:hypothetical protein
MRARETVARSETFDVCKTAAGARSSEPENDGRDGRNRRNTTRASVVVTTAVFPAADGLMRGLAVLALCSAPTIVRAGQQLPPSGPARDFMLNEAARRTLLTVDAIEAGTLDGGGSTVLRDKDGRSIHLPNRIGPQTFRNVPVRQVLDSLAQQTGIGVRLGPDIASTTTLSLTITRPTPAAEVFAVVLSAAGLRAEIVDAKVLAVSSR